MPVVPDEDWKPDLNIGPGGLRLDKDGLPRLTAPFSPVEAKQAQEAWAKHLGKNVEETLDLGDGVTLVVVLIPPGTFIMGQQGDKYALPHPVELTNPFYLGKYEVTQKQYQRVMGESPSSFSPEGKRAADVAGLDTSNHPVESVKWGTSREFGERLAAALNWKGKGGLPTEAEWEYAYRAGTTTKLFFGDEVYAIVAYGNASDASRKKAEPDFKFGTATWDDGWPFTAPVGMYKPNAFGLYDMAGNVSEWVLDYMGWYNLLPKVDPVHLSRQGAFARVYRGGGWNKGVGNISAAVRERVDPGSVYNDRGFRLCLRLDGFPQAMAPEPPFEEAKKQQTDWATKLQVPVETTSPSGLEMVLIPPAPGSEKPFYLGKYEVTQSEWEAVMKYNPSEFKAGNAKVEGVDTSRFPVEQVNWFDSVEFCNKLSEKEGLKPYYELTVTERKDSSIKQAEAKILGGNGYHIPTDAEWKRGCLAGAKGSFHFGDDEGQLKEYAWYEENSEGRTHNVGEKKPNAFGMYDSHGNVREWKEEMLTKVDGSPDRETLGGSWHAPARNCTRHNFYLHSPVNRLNYSGLRVARVP